MMTLLLALQIASFEDVFSDYSRYECSISHLSNDTYLVKGKMHLGSDTFEVEKELSHPQLANLSKNISGASFEEREPTEVFDRTITAYDNGTETPVFSWGKRNLKSLSPYADDFIDGVIKLCYEI